MKTHFYNSGQSLIGIIIVLVVVGLISGGLYYYLSKQIPEVPEMSEKTPTEETVSPEEKAMTPEEKITPTTTPTPEIVIPTSETVLPAPKPEKKSEVSGKCTAIFENGSPAGKINIYFYENGFNSNMRVFDDFVEKNIAILFGGLFNEENFSGIEPFKSLKKEFNVFTYKDEKKDCGPDVGACSLSTNIYLSLKESCPGFSASSDWGEPNGNYNILVFPRLQGGQAISSRVTKRLNSTTLRITSADTIYLNVDSTGFVHELGHRIGFFDEEYFYYDPYLGAKTVYPNIDSFSCTKWCQGVDTQSPCYQRYAKWLDCFKTKFIDNSSEIQEVLQKNNLNYSNPVNYTWWGTCFNAKNINICGQKIANLVDTNIRKPNQEWVSNWEYCKGQSPEAGPRACNLGLNCGENGCYTGSSYSRFLPSVENEFMMGTDNGPTAKFNNRDEGILKYNILNKIRYMDVENIEK